MKPFLEYVAEDLISKYGTDLSRTAVVFPNKRAALFMNDYLARTAGKPLWSPAYITISDLFRSLSPLQVADSIKLVCELHKSFAHCTGSTETLDHFYGWGQLLLADFDDIDKNMADADRVFANLRDLHELDDISYLSDEQREMIRKFFSNFTDAHDSELKERFLRLWSHFADIYRDFNERLQAQQLAYEGALYRQAATDESAVFPYERYLFVGFNLLQKVEQTLFRRLAGEGKARFYWDFDHYYMHDHEAGRYIAQYLSDFPNELPTEADDIYRNFRRDKQLTYISAPTENIQARYIGTWLRGHGRIADGRRTAIVLCDEGLLPTVIHCLPDEVDHVNITTGYPLAQSPIASLLNRLIIMQSSNRRPRYVRAVQRHPYARYLTDEVLFSCDNTGHDQARHILEWLVRLLKQIAVSSTDADDPLYQESLFRAYTLVNRLHGLATSGDLTVDVATLQRLVNQLVQSTSVPFHGEPAEGIQVMGILETRNLDFDHVLVLSCNEGNMPKGVNDSSFIPHSIRHAYELTTIENKVAIYAYYFHRLLQRAHDVTLLYNSTADDGHTGEMSRFMLQMMVESGLPVSRRSLQAGLTTRQQNRQSMEKTEHVMKLLTDHFAQREGADGPLLTPTAINLYMRCPLQFFYRYVSGLKEPDETDEDEIDNRVFGNIFHDAADIIYHRLCQKSNTISRSDLEMLQKTKIDIERAVDEAINRQLPPQTPRGGLLLINREVIIHYLHRLLDLDKELTPFTIIGLEQDVVVPMQIACGQQTLTTTIGGRIDRLDCIEQGGRIRVVDYKTGSKPPKSLPDVEAIFDAANQKNHSDYYLQTFVYSSIVRHDARLNPQLLPVSPALLFIQHTAGDNYDPTLLLGKQPVTDIEQVRADFAALLRNQIEEIFNPDIAFNPTSNAKTCSTCPYAMLCGMK